MTVSGKDMTTAGSIYGAHSTGQEFGLNRDKSYSFLVLNCLGFKSDPKQKMVLI